MVSDKEGKGWRFAECHYGGVGQGGGDGGFTGEALRRKTDGTGSVRGTDSRGMVYDTGGAVPESLYGETGRWVWIPALRNRERRSGESGKGGDSPAHLLPRAERIHDAINNED